jgi:hypothetical protein
MRALVNVFALLSAAAALLAALPAARAAGEEAGARSSQKGDDRWVPSLAVISGLTVQEWNGSVSSQTCPGCTLPSPNAVPLRNPASGDDRDVSPYVGGNFELMSPALPIPTSPRLFIGGDLFAAFGTERAVAQEGDPSGLRSPLPPGASGSTPFGEDSVLGQGSQTKAELNTAVYGAHAGIAFPFELYGRALRIKPLFAWIRYDVDVDGLVVDPQCTVQLNSTQCNTNIPGGFIRETRLESKGDDTFDGIGPGVDLEMDTGQFGPLGTSLFIGGRLYRLMGNRKAELGPTSESFNDALGTAESSARWSFEIDEWMYRVGIGMRFQWLGPVTWRGAEE